MIAMLAVDGDSSVDSQLARIGLDGAGRRWSVAPVQSGFRGPGWTWLDLAALLDTQEVRGSNPLRPTPGAPDIRSGASSLIRRSIGRLRSMASAASCRSEPVTCWYRRSIRRS